MRLTPGETRDLRVAYVGIPALQLSAEDQRYTRLEDGTSPRYRYESGDFAALLIVDDAGIVVDTNDCGGASRRPRSRTERNAATASDPDDRRLSMRRDRLEALSGVPRSSDPSDRQATATAGLRQGRSPTRCALDCLPWRSSPA